MARPNSVKSKKSPAQLKAAVKALEAFKKEDAKSEPVTDITGSVSKLAINYDTHMKIIISRSIGERLKSHIEDNEDCFDELFSWDTIIEKLLIKYKN